MALAADHLVCPACLDVCDGHIHQCPQGHLICSECDRSLASRTCPTCRGALPSAEAPERNRFAERMIAALPYAAWAGCGWTGLRAGQPEHEAACVYVSEVAPLKARLADLEPRAQHLQARGDAANEELQARVEALASIPGRKQPQPPRPLQSRPRDAATASAAGVEAGRRHI
ncbi:hypothetical protein EMIHUDRAFT_255668 [Emiliania huxleyi CCMP1516]|uniref:RING-type domain-containing protein n=2 Tax=Emiliania huxleyi TaxID=2903 RepID=A0A0D3J718_EMIH1|nr:hypothetical protein EMIHUDRAFT_255668 [Emiliania huxleyi CCMP1516]EOD19303.1 hypothetical protein EMIHUDRAFT_255668 [Emiliania huxleyi CCMP1516]|eukprot:XP_005771732.1 hypothetical protein EMIHUDRAFT_255668 [Emiliania huxleyi CCMP1516]